MDLLESGREGVLREQRMCKILAEEASKTTLRMKHSQDELAESVKKEISDLYFLQKRVEYLEAELAEEQRRRRLAEADLTVTRYYFNNTLFEWMERVNKKIGVEPVKNKFMFSDATHILENLTPTDKQVFHGRYEPQKKLKHHAKSHVPK